MNRKSGIIIGLLVALAVAAGIVIFITQKDANAPDADQNNQDTTTPNTQTNDDGIPSIPNEDNEEVLTGTVAIDMQSMAYQKPDIKVKKGTVVTWTNQDDVQHDVTHDEEKTGAPHSELLSKGQSYSFTFDTVGEFSYHCTPHPFMKGKVTVVE